MTAADLRPGTRVRPRNALGYRGVRGHVGVVTFSYYYGWGMRGAPSVEVTWFDAGGHRLGNYQCKVRDLVAFNRKATKR